MNATRRRMSSAARSWVVMGSALIAGMVLGGGYAFLEHNESLPGPILSALILLVVFGLTLAGTVWWWARADEAVREAHKWAWYWGGSIGMCIGLGALIFVGIYGGDVPVPAGVSYGSAMMMGASLVLTPMLLGYGVAWFAWWVSKGR